MNQQATLSYSGIFDLEVEVQEGATDEAIATIEMEVDRFIDALEIGLFKPATVLERLDVTPPEGVIARRFRAQGIPEYAFTVLASKMHHLDEALTKLSRFEMWEQSAPYIELLNIRTPPPSLPATLPSFVTMEIESRRITPGLEVSVGFQSPVLDADAREHYQQEMLVWHYLLQGGYSVTDELGQSVTSYPEVRFMTPSTIRYVTDSWWASPDCFVPLLNLVERWSAHNPVVDVEIATF